ncbi:MAG: hypothetical protein QME60_05745 [Verrucomicrobiota bacterium]|nr:hypothetical protein [Verrucomicrobiota bacterium]
MIRKIKPSLGWLALAAAVLLAGGGGAAWLLRAFWFCGDESVPFVAPGEIPVELPEPGLYALWHEARGTPADRLFDNPRNLPEGMTVSLIRADSGEAVESKAARGPPQRLAGGARHIVARYRVRAPGSYRVVATGGDGEWLLSFGASGGATLMLATIGGAALNALGLGGTAWIVIVVLANRAKMRHTLPDEEEG